MARPFAALTPDLIRRPARATIELPLAVLPARSRWRDDLRWFLCAWAAGFVAVLALLG